METRYVTAKPEDYDELMDFGNYVFSHAHGPTDFPSLLPKLYKREYFMDGIHYLAREEGGIRAAVGAYPLKLNILGNVLPGRGIGMVSVHPYARSKGYMRTLMGMALADMDRDGIVFSCLSGQRQRYEYFGFSPAGTQIVFECRLCNIRHALRNEALGNGVRGNGEPEKKSSPAFSVRQLKLNDGDQLEDIYRLHQSKAARFERDRGKFFDILSSWKNRVVALLDGNSFAGYLIYNDADNTITEINLAAGPKRVIEAVAGFLDYLGKKNDRDLVKVCAQPWETGKLEALAAFAEDYCLSAAYSFAVFNWQPLLSALLKLKYGEAGNTGFQAPPDGEVNLRIGNTGIRVAAQHGRVQVSPSEENGIVLNRLEAAQLFFSPLTPWASPLLRQNPLLREILPLPLFFENPDGV
jgi:predicted N-acetyltransferase YhbS